jgi:hypothetical protein
VGHFICNPIIPHRRRCLYREQPLSGFVSASADSDAQDHATSHRIPDVHRGGAPPRRTQRRACSQQWLVLLSAPSTGNQASEGASLKHPELRWALICPPALGPPPALARCRPSAARVEGLTATWLMTCHRLETDPCITRSLLSTNEHARMHHHTSH